MLTGTQRAPYVIAASICVALLCLAGLRWHSWRVAARQAERELAACQAVAAEIESFRASPKAALIEEQTEQQISLSIQRAAQVAEIGDADILRITPLQGRRIGKTSYIQQPTVVPIRQATLGQLSRFLGELSAIDVGLEPVSIRLSAPREPLPDSRTGATEAWAYELVLTYLVFSPE